ncbi:MAG: extracellular solute-binding protein [Acidobacteria bacterium]|nr:extracellular solute-binding protein [Acidobacteriota bacterium]MBI3657051.1 extracellular solute-binding protein [Acidobacteriota bacterium]
MGEEAGEVVIYVSEDRVFAEPVLQEFERRMGLRVKAVYDTEETKSTGLANRLLAEKNRPQADAFWSNEPVRTIMLKRNGVLAPYASPNAAVIPGEFKDPEGYWTGFAVRSRVIVYNTKLVKPTEAPQSMFDLTDARWKGQVAMADPRFGSTSFHAAVLFVVLGDERASKYFSDLRVNDIKIVDGNSVVRQMVSRGEVKIGWTDTDDVLVAKKAGEPVEMVYTDQQGLGVPILPNMVSLIKGGPHPKNGQKLIDYLLSPEVERMLAQSEAGQMPLHTGVEVPPYVRPVGSLKPMTFDYAAPAARVEAVVRRLQGILKL